jgi:hypothetical protein
MNQGIAFARTLRALNADDFRASKLRLVAAVALLCAWTWWMFASRVPQYESTTNVRIESGGAIAYFPPGVLAQIHADQPALVHVGGSTFPSRVQSIESDHITVTLPANSQLPPAASSSASAEVEVSRVSPAAIALQTLTRGNR